ncbi:helix-turn-helix transcriptional regulator [Herbiconiux sp. CPCC 205716]|uniref:Helix-turn-helix transcriptional regulator n=1 Tax=Herbiconiux gentiana TaxID=2970912 RepID=A0ABT2GDX2_9MICO|nr:helix-turn-helix transcriptional regulator [Herbiconiux gentiana]MCS5713822.1 helix-turn-helix transcriptional regulator [Herbiconiux gentiana]
MSPLRLFVLGSLDARGAMHGHQLRLLGEEERIHLWTDVSVGSLYGALKRLAAEGLIVEERTEREGSYPERQVYAITPSGRAALAELRGEGLRTLVLKHDPFDLAVSRLDQERLDELPAELAGRVDALRTLLADHEQRLEQARPYLSVAEGWVMEHRADRLRSEIASHERLISLVPEIVADERRRAGRLPEPLAPGTPRRASGTPRKAPTP